MIHSPIDLEDTIFAPLTVTPPSSLPPMPMNPPTTDRPTSIRPPAVTTPDDSYRSSLDTGSLITWYAPICSTTSPFRGSFSCERRLSSSLLKAASFGASTVYPEPSRRPRHSSSFWNTRAANDGNSSLRQASTSAVLYRRVAGLWGRCVRRGGCRALVNAARSRARMVLALWSTAAPCVVQESCRLCPMDFYPAAVAQIDRWR
ncbi:unnamed protein product [Pelagomonas calceolata]|uniref:Uncharacterized protein n=1 Tax=Pelagomonas calceolata TaxID=35677 RepID=A0A8J2SFL5_9STRA|nr:unnamed protein product [Pelagomonas calceolata]|mmetsp:Transcript_18122/g.51658  ORF Transcript_18122/g.51658 Transcript_18122/m.51658 type:complete len:203 (-) Transcript_18122:41-649(-)